MGLGEVPLEFEEREEGQLAVALHVALADSPLKAPVGQKRSPLLNALQFLLNKLLQRSPEGVQASAPTVRKVLLGIGEFPPRRLSARPLLAQPQAQEEEAVEEAQGLLPGEKTEQLSALASSLAQKSVSLGRVYAVLFLSRPQRSCMQQAASTTGGLRVFSEGEAHWSRLVFEPQRPAPMPQKSRIAFCKEASAKIPKALLSAGKFPP